MSFCEQPQTKNTKMKNYPEIETLAQENPFGNLYEATVPCYRVFDAKGKMIHREWRTQLMGKKDLQGARLPGWSDLDALVPYFGMLLSTDRDLEGNLTGLGDKVTKVEIGSIKIRFREGEVGRSTNRISGLMKLKNKTKLDVPHLP